VKKTTIIFDFDGTIADTLSSIYKIINRLAVENGLTELSSEEFKRLRDKHPFEIVKEYRIPLLKLPFLIRKGQTMMKKDIPNINFIAGIKETLSILKERGYRLGVLTSNSEENIKLFLDKNGLDLFEFTYTSSNLFGKVRPLNKIINKYKLKKDEIIYVGDEVRDIEACKKVGIQIIAVTWGFNSEDICKKYSPEYIVNKPEELLKIL
jgi:phosphoglycolate phosphatase-like HAD superfamily hydrolase